MDFRCYPKTAEASKQNSASALVVTVKHDQAGSIVNSDTGKKYVINQEVTQKMVDAGIRRLTGIDDISEAWKSIFPGITKDKVISIKINCIGVSVTGGLVSHPEVTYNIVNGLTQMKFDGQPFPEDNIIIWDRSQSEMTSAGFKINKNNPGVKCYATSYVNLGQKVDGSNQNMSKVLAEQSDYLINLCLLKDHSICGMTLSLKNHYGTIHNPGALHNNSCNPAIPVLNALPQIREKQVLCICDSIFAVISNGPCARPQVVSNSLLFSKDTVALDVIAANLLVKSGTSSFLRN